MRVESPIDLRAPAEPAAVVPLDRQVGLATMLDGVGVPLFVVDGHGRIDATNEAADRFCGCGPGELVGRSLRRVVPGWADDTSGGPDDQPPGPSGPPGRRAELRRRSGGTVPVTVTRRPVEVGGEALEIVAVVDGRERAVLQGALEHSEARFAALVDATADLVWVVDDRGLAREDSPSWRDFTGASWEQFRGMAWHAQVHPDDHAQMPAMFRSRRIGPIEIDLRLRAADGAWHPVAVRATPVRTATGALTAWVCRARVDVAVPVAR